MKDIQRRLFATFQIEHRDHVAQIRSLLALMARTGALPAGPEFEEIFRRAHSLKGAARAVELHPVEQLAHRLETLFSRVRQGACAFDERVERVTQQVLDASEDCMTALAGERQPETLTAALEAIGGMLGMVEPSGEMLNSAAIPTEAATSIPGFLPLAMLRISAENFDGLFRTAGRMAGETQRQDQVARQLDELVRNISRIEKASEATNRAARALRQPAGPGADSGLASVIEPLDSMERQMRFISRQVRTARRLHKSSQWSLRQLGTQLQDDIRQTRLAPAESLLEGYRRMMRDLARDEGKQIRFDATCASVHADRRVLDAIKDPIMHLLRNAVSHGIEAPATRVGKGKKPEGLVVLRIDADGQRLHVVLEDDGGGVDFARVAELAAREGIRSDAENPNESSTGNLTSTEDLTSNGDLTRVLFRAGFSTLSAVTTLSGRGMGLSVVYEAVRRLQGEVNLEPVSGGGTRIALSVPLSIASHRLMVVNCGKHVFAIPMPGIERLRRIERSKVETAGGKPVLVLDGQPTLLASLEDLLELEPASHRNEAPERHAVILRSGEQRLALAVDAILREADAMIQDIPYAAGRGGKISSGVVLDDGSIAFVVNPAELIRSAFRPGALQTKPRPQQASLSESQAPEGPSTILVVDDSMTTRALEKSILEAHGYRVRVAVDGVDALARLREEAADLVISDIEMPRLDGFGLIQAMKEDEALRKIPVIVVSSVERREDQERGLAVGADAYIVKRKFDQQELLGVIRQIL